MDESLARQGSFGRSWQLLLFLPQPSSHSSSGIPDLVSFTRKRDTNSNCRTSLNLMDFALKPRLVSMWGTNDNNHVLWKVSQLNLPTGRGFRKKTEEEVTAHNRGFENWVATLEKPNSVCYSNLKWRSSVWLNSHSEIYFWVWPYTIKNQPWTKLIPKVKHWRIQETHVSSDNMALAVTQEESFQLVQMELAAANTKKMILCKAEYSKQKKLKTNLGEVSVWTCSLLPIQLSHHRCAPLKKRKPRLIYRIWQELGSAVCLVSC